jgi:hypothetical protein
VFAADRLGLGCAFVCLFVCSPQIGALDLDLLVYLDLVSTKARTLRRRRRGVDAASTRC